MAKLKGILKIKGTLDEPTFYKQGPDYLVRTKGGVDGERIAKDPAFRCTGLAGFDKDCDTGDGGSHRQFYRVGIAASIIQKRQVMLYRYKATVVRVIDGDTIDVDIDLGFYTVLHKQRIRLYNVNAPELRGAKRLDGLASKAWLKSRIGGAEIELVSIHHNKGKYGRWLGVIILDGVNVNEEIWELGLG